MRFLLVGLFASMVAHADSGQMNIGFGASVPKSGGTSVVEHSGPSRATGGEKFTIQFRTFKTVTSIRLTGYSASKQGKILVHSATGFVTYDDGVKFQTNLEGLSQFAKVTSGNPDNYQNNVMLQDSHFVEVTPNAPFNSIELQVEGFTNNDAGMLLQLIAADGLPMQDFIIHRTASNEVAGGFIDESNYPALKAGELANLVQNAGNPALADLADHSFVCSTYSRTATNPDYKTRMYYNIDGALQSASNLDGTLYTWVWTEEGWSLGTNNTNGCGTYQTINILHQTAAGNLVSEVVIDRYNYLVLCTNAGYDYNAQAAQFDGETYPSVISPGVYRVISYEFCRPAALNP